MATTDLGRVCPVLQGAYATDKEYLKLDIVTSAGCSYIAKQTTTGNAPTNTTYWQLLAEAGDYAGTAEAMVGINLLHNYDMRTPVNQRGITGAYSTAGYFFDRWILVSGTVTPATGYLTLANATVIEQRIEGNNLAGKEVTVSAMIGGAVLFGTETFPTSAGTVNVAVADFGTVTLGYAAGYMYARFTASAARNVEMFKVELGTVSTLDRQPPVDYGTELLKCQRYLVAGLRFHGYGNTYSTTGGRMNLPCNKMRIAPTISGADTFSFYYGGSVYSFTLSTITSYPTFLDILFEGTGYTAVTSVNPFFHHSSNTIVLITAEL